jgi:predicted phosphodiesterase
LGDLCNYYPDSKGVLDYIIKRNVTSLLGNHDAIYARNIFLTKEKKLAYNYDNELAQSRYYLDYIQSLKSTIKLEFAKKILCCHGSPEDPLSGYVYPDTKLDKFSKYDADVIFMGHTHRQFIKEINGKIFCNVGSIGSPRDDGSLMGFVTYDTESNRITMYRKRINIPLVKKTYQNSTPQNIIQLLFRKENIQYSYNLI